MRACRLGAAAGLTAGCMRGRMGSLPAAARVPRRCVQGLPPMQAVRAGLGMACTHARWSGRGSPLWQHGSAQGLLRGLGAHP